MSKGYCTWTYHPADGTRPAGYWTVVSRCNRGYSCSKSLANKPLAGLEVEHNEFVTEVTAEWTAMTSAESDILNRRVATNSFDMPCA
ncbi:hypothetical protein [Paludisphaera soli]|uniref:hypothetical protein n=1 Tax=Paludisphaera soli TaxID=2712865 RepID=UPI0013E9FD93|nr:hypothetical protein [Paludisphaera soli]